MSVTCELALAEKAISADYILNVLSRLRPSPAIGAIATPAQLRLTHEPLANCQRYDELLCVSASKQEVTHETA